MAKAKFQSLEKRTKKMQDEGRICEQCKEKPPVIVYHDQYLCADCLNPPVSPEYLRDIGHHWCGVKSSFGGA